MVNDREFFSGVINGYNTLFKYSSNRFREILEDYGIKQVYMMQISETAPINKDTLYYEDLTLVVQPTNILNHPIDLYNNIKTFNKSNQTYNICQPIELLSDENVQRITYNDIIIGDYYPSRNLIISYYNPFPSPPRIRSFQGYLNFLFSKIDGLKKIDNSEKKLQATKKKNYALFSKNITNKYSKLMSSTEEQAELIKKYSNGIVKCDKIIQDNVEVRKVLKNLLENFDDAFEKRIDELNKLPFLKKVTINNQGIVLDYGNVNINYQDTDYYIGYFNIILKYDCVVFSNTNNRANNMHHPHIYKDGHACFGSYNVDVSRLLSQLQFKKLAILLRQMLHSYNPRSPVNNIEHWKNTILKENLPKNTTKTIKKTIKRTVQNISRRNNMTIMTQNIVDMDEYKNGTGLANELYSSLSPTQRLNYINNRRRNNR